MANGETTKKEIEKEIIKDIPEKKDRTTIIPNRRDRASYQPEKSELDDSQPPRKDSGTSED